jgi:hypothetical protein
MNARADKIAWPAAFLVAASVFAAPARAQFEEPDTIPRFAVGPFVEANFRGKRAEREVPGEPAAGTSKVSFGNGPAYGVRGECRISGTVTFAATASYARMDEREESGGTAQSTQGNFSQFQFTGALALKLKPRVPGYVILGGGARIVDSGGGEDRPEFHAADAWTEPLGLAGLGIELGSRRRYMFRLEFRFYFVSLGGDTETFATNSLGTEYSLGLAFLYRP